MLIDLIKKNRSYRRFYEDKAIKKDILISLVDLARLSPSGANLQPLRYFLSADAKTNRLIFPNLAWAGYLQEWDGPMEGERPSAYILILSDQEIKKNIDYDLGIACQSILLGAAELDLGGCIIASVKRESLHEALNLPGELKVNLVIALGHPKEKVVIDDLTHNDVRYWRDEDQVHHVPKRALKDIIIR